VVLFFAVAILAPVLVPYSPTASAFPLLQAPTAHHPFGTDSLGRDVLSRTIAGSQVSLVVAGSVVLIHGLLSTTLGLLSGFYGRWIDYLIQRSGEAFHAFPGLILYFLIIAAFGRPKTEGGNILVVAWDLRVLIFALSIGAIFGGSRILRSATLSLKQRDFVLAARSLGASDTHILFRHILPNVLPLLLVMLSSAVGGIIIAESSLEFLGLGVSAGTPSWGADLAGRNRTFFLDAPWMILAPGLAVSLTVLGFNFFGDALRDVLDPRLRGRTGRG
jgi:ABC-type dipeptide/oligopeptide/nickel transport system permease subunit